MATSGTITGSVTNSSGAINSNYTFTAEWKRNSYSIESNTSNITVNLQIKYTYSTNGAYNLDRKPDVSLTVNGASQTPTISVIDTRNNKVCTFATWTGNVTHNNDGSLSCPISASFTHYGSTSLKTGSVSGYASIDTIPRASSLSLSSSSVNVGGSITASITRASSSFTHAVEFYINSTYYQKYTGVATSQSFIIPTSWYNAMSSSSSCTAYCRITTYSGSTQIGSQVTKSFTVSASSTGPSAGTVTVDAVNITTSDGISRDVLVKGKNKVTVSASNFKAGSGSSIVSYRFDVLYGSTTIATTTTTSSSVSLGPFNQSGSLTFRVTITDQRNQTASNQITYTCHDYVAPYFTAFNAYRANSDGSANVNGTYLKCTYTQQYSSVGSTNSTKITVYYNNKTSSSTLINLGENSTTYQVYLTITDNYGGSNRSSTITVFGAARVLNITSDGTGVAIGKMADKSELFESRWPAKFDSSCEIDGNCQVDGGLTVNGNLTLNSAVSNLTVSGNLQATGGLTVGTSTQESTPTNGITVHDVRNATITPNSFGDKNVNFYFDALPNQHYGGHYWHGIMHMKGWNGNYAAWELAGNAESSSLDHTLRYRQGIGNTWGDWQNVVTTYDSTGALSRNLTLPSGLYYTSSTYGLNCNSSDITNVNGTYFNRATSAGNGINFYRWDGNWDTLYAIDGALRFQTNRGNSTGLGGNNIYHNGNFKIETGTVTLNSSTETSRTFASTTGFAGTPNVLLTPVTSTTGIITAKIRSVNSAGFTAIIGGSVSGSIPFAYIAIYGNAV